ncbi:hypothetical protein Taro_018044 [Colocasia esculenta]|uniref:Pectinesterase inhibitor domain-containing protein n=1 Tax=Colocasia esculenta TaxID=4460 RepID=A0A843UPS3_COLES|nr:hypothetical protein [Colocasia esculenta]
MAPLAVVAAALLLLLSHPAQARVPEQHFAVKVRAAAGGKNAASLCSSTDYPDICASAAKDIRGPVSEKALIQASIQAAIKKVQEAKASAAALGASLFRVSKDKMAKGNLRVCQEVYDTVVADLHKSLDALKSGTAQDLNIRLSAAMTDVDTCEDGYAEAGTKSPLAGPDSVTGKHASNALTLAKMLKTGH